MIQIEEWSPWNCVLLTKEEAAAHRQIDDPLDHYDSIFLRKVASKHDTARNHFLRLPWLVKYVKAKTTKEKRESILGEQGTDGYGKEPRSCRVKKEFIAGA